MVKSCKIPNFMGHDDEVVEKKKIGMKWKYQPSQPASLQQQLQRQTIQIQDFMHFASATM